MIRLIIIDVILHDRIWTVVYRHTPWIKQLKCEIIGEDIVHNSQIAVATAPGIHTSIRLNDVISDNQVARIRKHESMSAFVGCLAR